MRFFTIALTLLLTASPAAAQWTQVRSAHYLFLGDARPADLRRVAQRFEQFHLVMQQLTARAAFATSAPTVVLVMKDRRSLEPFLPLHDGKPVAAAGVASTSPDFNYIAMNAAGGDEAFPVVFHELAHVLSNNVWSNPAPWYSEGVAEYYSTFDLRSASEVRIGAPIVDHVMLLRQRMMPLRELLEITDVKPLLDEQNRSTLFYAQSWALVHLLLNRDPQRAALARYKVLSEQGVSQEEAVTKAFGMDLPTLEKQLHAYVNQFTMLAIEWKLLAEVRIDSLVATEIDASLVAPHLAFMQHRLRRHDEAEASINAALAAAPRSATANAVLAAIRLQQERPDEAWAALSGDLTFEDFFDDYFAAALTDDYLQVTRARGEHADAALKLLHEHSLAATKARRDVPQAWHFAARAHLLAGRLSEAAAANTRALEMAPANEIYRFTEAEVLARRGDVAASRQVLGRLMAYGRSPAIRAEARRLMGELPGFRAVGPDETRVFGTMHAVECSSGGISLVIDVDGARRRITASAFEEIEFITYRSDLTGKVTCGSRAPADRVYVTWRGLDSGAAQITSNHVVVEFTPSGYTPQ